MAKGAFEAWVAAYALRIRFCPMTWTLLVSSCRQSRQTAQTAQGEETYREADEAEVANWLSHGGQMRGRG
jgi:hypothetical protein